MGNFLDSLKNEASLLLSNKKNLINLLILGILILALPLAVGTIRQQQIIKSRAAADPIVFTGPNVEQREGKWVALKPQIQLELTSPLGPPAQSAPPPVDSLNPKGSHDTSSCTVNAGWTCDPSDYNQALEVHFYKDGPYSGSSANFIGSTLANVTREAGVAAQCGGKADHGFSFPMPDSLKDGKEHTIYAYAINSGTGDSNPLLTGTPKTITCNASVSLLPKGLVGTVYAAECEPGSSEVCPSIEQCSNGAACASGHKYCVWSADGNHKWGACQIEVDNCASQCSGGGGTGDCSSNQYKNAQGQCVNKIGSSEDGPGGCCDPGKDNTPAGCRSDNKPGGYREVCDISNGSCASGKSCRSQTSSGCGRNSDCGPGNQCVGGICKTGPPAGQCQSASSLEARFSVNGNLQDKATIDLGKTVIAAVFRSGSGQFAGSKVNDEYKPTDVLASISGPPGAPVPTLDLSKGTDFTPTVAGPYTLSATCGSVTGQATLTVTGGTAPPTSPPGGTCSLPSPSITEACASCIKSQPGRGNLPNETKELGIKNGQSWGSCTDSQLISQWCTGIDATSCNSYKTTACASACGGITPPPVVTTVAFRVAESPSALGSAPWKDYTAEPMLVNFEFTDKTAGVKFVWVEFKDSKNKTERRNAQIRLLGADPTIANCSLSFEGNNTILELKGQNFGSTKGVIKSNETSLQARQWKNDSIQAIWPNAPEGETLPVALTNADSQTAEGTCSAIAQLALGAKVFCRAPSSHDTDNVDMVLVGDFEGGKKTKQKVRIDRDGVVQGLTQKLEDGKKYKVSIKAPRSVRKTVEFTAGGGVTNIPNFVLPVGDIAPADGGDGTINSLDKGELNRQWVIAADATGRSGDFNKDGRVNSIDWACMRYDFNASDDAEPTVPTVTVSPSTGSTGVGSTAGQ